jgi:hypothetical protein
VYAALPLAILRSTSVTILLQFVFRLSFGLALAMALTPPRFVSSGYYRNHSYVLFGLNVLAAAVAWLYQGDLPLWPPIVAAVLSYFAAVIWLYERPRPGIAALLLVAGVSLWAAWQLTPTVKVGWAAPATGVIAWWARPTVHTIAWLDPISGGLVLGATMAAMLLGHWYLNAPGMKLAPLRRLVLLMVGSLVLRSLVCGAGFLLLTIASGVPSRTDLLFIALRWLAGLVAAAGMAWMTWRILKIPNTQSATGVLYVAVIVTFVGELTSQLLANRLHFPL